MERSCLFIKYHGYFQNEDVFKDGCYFGLSSAGLKEENAELDKSVSQALNSEFGLCCPLLKTLYENERFVIPY